MLYSPLSPSSVHYMNNWAVSLHNSGDARFQSHTTCFHSTTEWQMICEDQVTLRIPNLREWLSKDTVTLRIPNLRMADHKIVSLWESLIEENSSSHLKAVIFCISCREWQTSKAMPYRNQANWYHFLTPKKQWLQLPIKRGKNKQKSPLHSEWLLL